MGGDEKERSPGRGVQRVKSSPNESLEAGRNRQRPGRFVRRIGHGRPGQLERVERVATGHLMEPHQHRPCEADSKSTPEQQLDRPRAQRTNR